MVYDKAAQIILKRIGEALVIRKSELVNFMKGKTNPGSPKDVVNSVTKMLTQRGLITPLYASESTFAITQKGMKELSR